MTSNPVVALNADGRLQVFARGLDNDLITIAQTTAGGDRWTSWTSLGGYLTSEPAVGNNPDGRLLVSVVGQNNDLWYVLQNTSNSATWSNWQSLGGYAIGKPTIAQNADGRLEIFARGGYFDIWHRWQTQVLPNGEIRWSGWQSLWQSLNPLYTSNIAISKNADGGLEMFAKDGHNSLWLMYQLAPNIDQ